MKFLFILFLSVNFLNANFLSEVINISKNLQKEVKDKQNKYIYISLNKYFNYKKCNKVLENHNFDVCYSYKYKGPLYVSSTVYGNLVDGQNTQNVNFYIDKRIPKKYRAYPYDYKGFDRGHAGLSNASNDYNYQEKKSTYILSQITPQYKYTNRISYKKIEERTRELSKVFGKINVLTMMKYGVHPKKIGKHNISVSKYFIKVLYSKKNKFQECYIINNNNKIYNLNEMRTNCSDVLY